jgi:RNA polymerase sigma-70 factor (ECF subfamily)
MCILDMVGDRSSSPATDRFSSRSRFEKFEIGVNRLTNRGRNTSWGELTVSVPGAADRLAAEEADLVAQIAAGDTGVPVAELYRRYAKRLYRFGVQRLGNNGLADEMVQETFVRLWRTAGNFDAEKASVQTYLYVVARSVAADLRKRPSSRPLLPVEDVDLPPQPDTVDQILDRIIVREALESLGSGHAQVIALAQDEGLTQSQIAARLGLPLGTVKTRMFHGMRAMRVALAERGFSAL